MKKRQRLFNWVALSASLVPLVTLASCGESNSGPQVIEKLTEEEAWDRHVLTTTQEIEKRWQDVYKPFTIPWYYPYSSGEEHTQYDPGPGYTFEIPVGQGLFRFKSNKVPRDFQLRPDTVKIMSDEFNGSNFFFKHQFILPEKVYEIRSDAFANVVLPKSFRLHAPMYIVDGAFFQATLYEDFIIPLMVNVRESDKYKYYIHERAFEDAILPPGCNWFNGDNQEVFPEEITDTNYPTWGWQVRVSRGRPSTTPTVATSKNLT